MEQEVDARPEQERAANDALERDQPQDAPAAGPDPSRGMYRTAGASIPEHWPRRAPFPQICCAYTRQRRRAGKALAAADKLDGSDLDARWNLLRVGVAPGQKPATARWVPRRR